MDLKGKKTIVVGAGRSGVAASRLLVSRGAEVILNDAAPLDRLAELDGEGIRLAGGGHRPDLFRGVDLVVLSPGVPTQGSPLREIMAGAAAGGAEVIGEMELASRFVDVPIVAVAGTNGKSTTTTLIGNILKRDGKRVFAGGNLGTPLSSYVIGNVDAEIVVLEVSSFQLETTVTFRPHIAVMLNITPDHLDRYRSMDDYVAAKKRLFMNQGAGDYVVINMDDPLTASLSEGVDAAVVPFGSKERSRGGVWMEDRSVLSEITGPPAEIDLPPAAVTALHEENVMAAVAAATLCGAALEAVSEGLEKFDGLPHRMELVGEACGVRFYDDSKATNVGAVVKSLEMFDNVVLIAGGKDKGGGYEDLKRLVRERVKAAVLIGEAAGDMKEALQNETEVHLAAGMEDAVELAWAVAGKGDTILLSPACSSFDMFSGYAERGTLFRNAALKIIAAAAEGGGGKEAVVVG